MTLNVILFAIILMAAVLVVLFAVVMLTGMHKESKLNNDLFMSSTSMWFDKGDFHARATC